MDNEDDNLLKAAETAIEEAALDSDPPDDPDSPRDAWWLRWLKFVAVIAVPAITFGLGFVFVDYMEEYRATGLHDRIIARQNVDHDTIGTMKFRFWLGACISGGLGAIYVARCIIQRTDP